MRNYPTIQPVCAFSVEVTWLTCGKSTQQIILLFAEDEVDSIVVATKRNTFLDLFVVPSKCTANLDMFLFDAYLEIFQQE